MVFRAGQRDPCTLDVARFSESINYCSDYINVYIQLIWK